MFFPETILRHLFPVDDFIGDILFGGFYGLGGEKQSDNVGVGGVRDYELGWDDVLWTWDYFRWHFIVHDNCMFEGDTVATFCHYCRIYALFVSDHLFRHTHMPQELFICHVIHYLDGTLVAVDHWVDIISKGHGGV